MQNLPQAIGPIEEKIIEMSMDQNPREIANSLSMPIKEIFKILETPQGQQMRDIKLKSANAELQYKRLRKANDIVDELMEGIEKLVKKSPETWKMAHVKLFELLMKEIPEQVKTLNQINNFNVQTKSRDEKTVEDSLESKMEQLPAELKMKFWLEVERLAQDYINEYNAKKVPDSQGGDHGSPIGSN